MMIAIRGATTIKRNTSEDIKEASIELMSGILNENNIQKDEIISIIISCTNDITKAYPGKFIREHFNLNKTAIMHFNEMQVENSLPLCIRILLLVKSLHNKKIKYIYLNNAKILRKDLILNSRN